ncbi:amino acid ABC transporter ATP-binding protein [Faecalicatena sp. Marseille-Q4148]|nr:amino acid ABC transporter ATP-binding protein [Faecalicatena sp. Marseille-Q4148]
MIKVENLKKNFGELQVLDGISFQLDTGKVLAVIGPSGTGKSTLLRCINYLEKPAEGMITIDDVLLDVKSAKKDDIYRLREQTAMVFQNYNLFKNKTALENIMEPMVSVQGMSKLLAKEKATEILESIGLLEKAEYYPAQLSGGQQQRIGIGRAMAVNPKVMLIDEPTSSLDPELVGEVLNLLYKLAKERTTMIIATHEMNFAKNIADWVIFLEDGKIIEEGYPEDFFERPKTERAKQFLNKFVVDKQ